MSAVDALRERTIGAWQAVVTYSDTHNGAKLASEQRELTKLGEAALAAEKQWRTASAEAGRPIPEVEDGLDATHAANITAAARTMVGQHTRPSGMGNGLPFSGRQSPGSGRPGRLGIPAGDWGDAVLNSVSPGGRFQAALLTGGAVPVSVPLRPIPVSIAERAHFLSEIIPQEVAENGRAAYLVQTTRTNNAAPVASAALKPTSVYTYSRVDVATATVAHLSEPIGRNDLSDAPLLRSFVDNELVYGLQLALDAQIISGSGIAPNMTGILTTSGIQVQAFATDAIQSCRKGITKLEVSDLEPGAIVMSPTSWEKVELLAQAQFASNDGTNMPVDAMARRLFGVRVVVTNAMPADTALIGDFAGSSVLFVTQEATVDWSENSYDPNALGAGVGAGDFSRNLIRFRAEGRWLIAVTRPVGFVKVALA